MGGKLFLPAACQQQIAHQQHGRRERRHGRKDILSQIDRRRREQQQKIIRELARLHQAAQRLVQAHTSSVIVSFHKVMLHYTKFPGCLQS